MKQEFDREQEERSRNRREALRLAERRYAGQDANPQTIAECAETFYKFLSK